MPPKKSKKEKDDDEQAPQDPKVLADRQAWLNAALESRQPPKLRKKLKVKLPVAITGLELDIKAHELSKAIRERDEWDAKRKAVMSAYKDKINGYTDEIRELGEQIETGSVPRMVHCHEYGTDEGEIIIVRQDTGVVVQSRPMTAQERQQGLLGIGDDDMDGPPPRDTEAPPPDETEPDPDDIG
jgi:hypothetical protein